MNKKYALCTLLFAVLFCSPPTSGVDGNNNLQVPVLVYHEFGPVAANEMTVRTSVFASHLQYLKENGYTVIPLKQLIAYRLGKGPPPHPRSVVITADDGKRSVYTEMITLVKQYRVPITVFIYPSAISHASYAMTWEQLRELKESGLVDIQSHTYWHPNFRKEKKRLSADQYAKLVNSQLTKAKETLERRLGIRIDMLAWPFGIHDAELEEKAAAGGYLAAFTLRRQHVTSTDSLMALPRYLVTDRDRGAAFAKLVSARTR